MSRFVWLSCSPSGSCSHSVTVTRVATVVPFLPKYGHPNILKQIVKRGPEKLDGGRQKEKEQQHSKWISLLGLA